MTYYTKAGFSFWRGNLDALSQGHECRRDLEAREATLAQLGFIQLGDVVCERFPEVVLRALGRADGKAWAILGGSTGGMEWTEFYTPLGPALSLTTTTIPGGQGQPGRGIHFRRGPARPEELWQLHREGLDGLDANGVSEPSEPTLEAFCLAVESFLVRSSQ